MGRARSAACPVCQRPSTRKREKPCACTEPCRCDRCSCRKVARGWVKSNKEEWHWLWRCSGCGQNACKGDLEKRPSSSPPSQTASVPASLPIAIVGPIPAPASTQDVWASKQRRQLASLGSEVASSTLADSLCANPLKRLRLHRDEWWLQERVRGVGKPLAPVGSTLVILVPLLRGDGRLIPSALAGGGSREVLRVAYSLAMLMERGISESLGPAGLKASLRAQRFDVDVRVHTFGVSLTGGSCGLVAFLSMVQAMTECSFPDQLSSTGLISLTGRVYDVHKIHQKAAGAIKQGQTAVVLPSKNQGDVEALPPEVSGALDFHFVSDVVEALHTTVIGWQRRTSLRLPTQDVASMELPMTNEGIDWIMAVEAAVVPGHGEVHITGAFPVSDTMSDSFRDAIVWTLTNQAQILQLLQIEVSKRTGRKVEMLVDLEAMRYTSHHPWAAEAMRAGGDGVMRIPDKSLDLHVNLPTLSHALTEPGYSAALVVLLASLLTGVPVPPKVAVVGHCPFSGFVGTMFSDCNQRVWELAEREGIEKLYLDHLDYDAALGPEGDGVDMTRVPTVRVEVMMQCLREVFGS